MVYATELKSKIKKPSKVFSDFIEQYFESGVYLSRGEWDRSLPLKLSGEELSVAKEIIVKNIHLCYSSILYAARVLDMRELIPEIKNLINANVSLLSKYYLISCLYEWEGDTHVNLFQFCKDVLSQAEHENSTFSELYMVDEMLSGIVNLLKRHEIIDIIFLALISPVQKIREHAYFTLQHYVLEIKDNVFGDLSYDYDNEDHRKIMYDHMSKIKNYSSVFVSDTAYRDKNYIENINNLRAKYEIVSSLKK